MWITSSTVKSTYALFSNPITYVHVPSSCYVVGWPYLFIGSHIIIMQHLVITFIGRADEKKGLSASSVCLIYKTTSHHWSIQIYTKDDSCDKNNLCILATRTFLINKLHPLGKLIH